MMKVIDKHDLKAGDGILYSYNSFRDSYESYYYIIGVYETGVYLVDFDNITQRIKYAYKTIDEALALNCIKFLLGDGHDAP